jgi:hypothetical protein
MSDSSMDMFMVNMPYFQIAIQTAYNVENPLTNGSVENIPQGYGNAHNRYVIFSCGKLNSL